jgi:hypothetical protein
MTIKLLLPTNKRLRFELKLSLLRQNIFYFRLHQSELFQLLFDINYNLLMICFNRLMIHFLPKLKLLQHIQYLNRLLTDLLILCRLLIFRRHYVLLNQHVHMIHPSLKLRFKRLNPKSTCVPFLTPFVN